MVLAHNFWNNHTIVRRGKWSCWEWNLSRSHNGYGKVSWYGRHMRANRVAWMLHNKSEIPIGLVVMHRCDNPSCINPKHLMVGTLKENSWDMVAKGRANGGSPPGERSGKAKLTDSAVRAMRLAAIDGCSYRELGRMFGISHQNARLAVLGRTWAHVE